MMEIKPLLNSMKNFLLMFEFAIYLLALKVPVYIKKYLLHVPTYSLFFFFFSQSQAKHIIFFKALSKL
jgi:hypothetical protein